MERMGRDEGVGDRVIGGAVVACACVVLPGVGARVLARAKGRVRHCACAGDASSLRTVIHRQLDRM